MQISDTRSADKESIIDKRDIAEEDVKSVRAARKQDWTLHYRCGDRRVSMDEQA